MGDFDGEILGPNPIQIPAIYETCVAGGLVSPGVCEVSGFSRSWDWDVKKAKGSTGATTTLQGQALAKGQIKYKLWLPEHFQQWIDFRDVLIRGLTQKKIEAIDILHPYLQELEIFSLVVEEIGQMMHEGRGLYSVTVKFIEYRPPKPAGGSPSGSGGWHSKKKPGTTPANAQDAQDSEIQKLLDEAKQP